MRESKAGVEPAFTRSEVSDIFTTSVGLSREHGAANRKWIAAAQVRRYCELVKKARSAIGVRLIASFPPAGPARLGTRVSARAPGSGSPVPACAGKSR